MKSPGTFARAGGRQDVLAAIVIGGCLAAFAIFGVAVFGKLFLLIEYRTWATPLNYFNPLKILDPATIFNADAMSVARSRAFPIFLTAIFSSVCGRDSVCHNLFHIAILTLSGLFTALTIGRLAPGAPLFFRAGALVFFLFTEPMLDALAWQATILDKLALLFTTLGIYLAARLPLERRSAVWVVIWNVAGLLVVFCGYNSKEAGFALVPAMVALVALRVLDAAPALAWREAWRALRTSLTLLAAPAAYGLFHVAVVFWDRVLHETAGGEHLTGGDAIVNLYAYVLYLTDAVPFASALGLYPSASRMQMAGLLLASTGLVIAAGVLVVRRAPRGTALLWLWAAGSLLLTMAIPLRTFYNSPFYLLVPSFYLTLLLFITVVGLTQAFPTRRAATWANAVVAFVLAAHIVGFAWQTPPYARRVAMSANFVDALARVRAQLERTPNVRAIVFLWPKREVFGYMYLEPHGASALAEYLLPADSSQTDYAALNAVIEDASYAGDAPHPAPKPGTITVVLGDGMKAEAVVPPAR